MFRILSFLVFVVFHGANAQAICVPDHVGNVSLDLNYVLHWTSSENCYPTHYLIYVHIEENLQFIFNTEDTHLDVNFLPACERFQFIVRAFSNSLLSDESRLELYMPAPSGANLTIAYINATRQGSGLLLNWEVDEKFAHCARAFRVVIRDNWFATRDVYTQTNSLLVDNIVPCAEYEFTVTAIYTQQSEGPIQLIRYDAADDTAPAPYLLSVVPGNTYVNLTFAVANYAINRCPISGLRVSGPNFSRTFPYTDSPVRPESELTVSPLQDDTMYFFGVFVVNSAGSSEPFAIAVQTLPTTD